jgi:hypothetical protein
VHTLIAVGTAFDALEGVRPAILDTVSPLQGQQQGMGLHFPVSHTTALLSQLIKMLVYRIF